MSSDLNQYIQLALSFFGKESAVGTENPELYTCIEYSNMENVSCLYLNSDSPTVSLTCRNKSNGFHFMSVHFFYSTVKQLSNELIFESSDRRSRFVFTKNDQYGISAELFEG
jgi:hypothetical protein